MIVIATESEQLSETIGAPMSPTYRQPALVPNVFLAGQTTPGGSSSTTVIRCVQLELFPASSVAVHVTIVDPRGSSAGALLVMVMSDAVEH